MLKTYDFSTTVVYYDIERKTVARIPTKSNLLLAGSDNSLYFGLQENKAAEKVFCSVFDVTKLCQLSGTKRSLFYMGLCFKVTININAQGQIQIRFDDGNGTIRRIISLFISSSSEVYSDESLLIVCDFNYNQLRVLPVECLSL